MRLDLNLDVWLQQLMQQGVHLSVEGQQLRIRAPQGVLTAEVRAALKARKAELVARLQRAKQSSTPLPTVTAVPEARYDPFPLTDIQHAFWIGQTAGLELSGGYHTYTEYTCADLDVPRLTGAWQSLIKRHEMLRAVVLPPDQQKILDEISLYQIPVLDLVDETETSKQEQLTLVRSEMSHQVFDLTQWPLFDIRVTQVEAHRYHLHLSFAMIMLDGGSYLRLLYEWNQLYQQPATQLPSLDISYRDYVVWEQNLQTTELYMQARNYWLRRLETLPPAPNLPQNSSSGPQMQPVIVHRDAHLDSATWQRLKEHARAAGVTTTALLTTIFAEIMATWSSQPHFTLNLTFFNRLPVHPQINGILGDFSTVNLLQVAVEPTATLLNRARQLHQQLWTDLEYRYFSGVQVIREFARQHSQVGDAIMPIVFTSLLGVDQQVHLNGSPINHYFGGQLTVGLSQTPQVLLDMQVEEQENRLFIRLDSADEWFPKGLVEDIFSAYVQRLTQVAINKLALTQSPPCLVPAVQLEQRAASNATTAAIPEVTLSGLFSQQVECRPEALAICSSDHRQLTYQEVYNRAQQVAYWLHQHEIQPNTLVAIVMEKGWQQIVGVFGILLAGAAYLPIDPALPEERRNYLLENGEVQLLLTQPKFDDSLAWPTHVQRLYIDGQMQTASISPLAPVSQPTDLVYVLYTSGSTGQPKGVMIEHRGVVNRMLDVTERFQLQQTDRVLALTALHHDISAFDIFAMLTTAGGALVMPAASKIRDPAHWVELIKNNKVTIWFSVPAFMQMLIEYLESMPEVAAELRSLRLVLLGGDFIPVTLPGRLKTLLPQVEFYSVGGPTETSVLDICYPVTKVEMDWKSIPYGKPMNNTQYHVLNDNLEPCPTWVPGELYIGGIGVGRGYWRDVARTEASFIIHPQKGTRLYRSGDLGRYLPDGNLEILGRRDFQVKIHGQRIELGEIETNLLKHPTVKEVVVHPISDANGNKQLVAYVVRQIALLPSSAPVLNLNRAQMATDIISDPVERAEFKLSQAGLRSLNGKMQIDLPCSLNRRQRYLARQSYRQFAKTPITLEAFGIWLNNLGQLQLDEAPLPKYLYPSGGGLYPVQSYIYIKPNRVRGVASGFYYYHPAEHRLVLLSADHSEVKWLFANGHQYIFDEAAFALFLVGNLNAIVPMYGEAARDYCLLEAGYMSQLLMLEATTQHLGLCPMGVVNETILRTALDLEENQLILHSLVGGRIAPMQMTQWLQPAPKADHWQEEIRTFLQGKLPAYMVPALYVELDALPLNANGKVNRQALPVPERHGHHAEENVVAPRTPLEQQIADLWGEVLNRQSPSVEQNFLESGGDSLQATRLVARLRQTFSAELSLRTFFANPTIAQLSEVIEAQALSKVDSALLLAALAELNEE